MKRLILFIFLILIFLQSYSFANYGRISYIYLKSKELIYCELLTVRDSLLVVSKNISLDDREIIRQMDSLCIIECNQIDFIKLVEQKAPYRNRLLFSLIGLGAGIGFSFAEYERNNSFRATSYISIPLGLIAGYLFGAYFDVSNYKAEEIIFPDCQKDFKSKLLLHCRYTQAEPPRFKSRLNKILADELNK